LATIKVNEKIHIKFGQPKGKSFPEPSRFQRVVENLVTKVLTAIIPKGNPDFDDLISEVDFWKVEYDKMENIASREIGFDKNGNSIVAMPMGENYGYWTDNNLTLDDFERFDSKRIELLEFENDWNEFENKYKR